LLDKLASDHFEHTDEALRQDILHFFNGHGAAEQESRVDPCDAGCRLKTWIEVNQLRAVALLDPADRPQPQLPAQTSPRSQEGAIASSPAGNNARM